MLISSSKLFPFLIILLVVFVSNFEVHAQKNESLNDQFFDVYIKPKDTPVYKVDSELMHILSRRESKRVRADMAKQQGVSEDSARDFYSITHKEVATNGRNFGVILVNDLMNGKKSYQILGVKQKLISIRCVGKRKSPISALNTSCSKAVKKVFNLTQDGLEKLFKEDLRELDNSEARKKQVRSTNIESASSKRNRKFFSNSNSLSRIAKKTTSENSRKVIRSSFKRKGEVETCRDITVWDSIVVTPNNIVNHRAASLIETPAHDKPIRLYCKKAEISRCSKERSWLNYDEYLNELFGVEIKAQEIVSTSQQTNYTNGEHQKKLCLRFKKRK